MGKKVHFVDIEQKEDVRALLINKMEAHIDVSSLSFNNYRDKTPRAGDTRRAAFSLNFPSNLPRYCPLCLKEDPVPYFGRSGIYLL
jgi:hypothetical protein